MRTNDSRPGVIDELLPGALHDVEQYANNRVESDHGRLKARLRPMRGLKTHKAARVIVTGHAFVLRSPGFGAVRVSWTG